MAIPTYDEMLRPILAKSDEQTISRQLSTEMMEKHFNLSAEDRASVLPSGGNVLRNRVGWAMTFLTKGGLIQKIAPKMYGITAAGRDFLRAHPRSITTKDLETIEGWEEAWEAGRRERLARKNKPAPGSATPVEAVDEAVESIHTDVRSRLLKAIIDQPPEFFERLVLDVLLAMGYGGSRAEAGEHLGKSGDEGIDGRINQDPLGLDQILVQAKRHAPESVIDRKTIQAFIGSLAGQGVTKGIFITTSSYAATAREFVQRGSNTKVVLIDGVALIDLMMRHHIGVRVERSVQILDLDQNYFEEGE